MLKLNFPGGHNVQQISPHLPQIHSRAAIFLLLSSQSRAIPSAPHRLHLAVRESIAKDFPGTVKTLAAPAVEFEEGAARFVDIVASGKLSSTSKTFS